MSSICQHLVSARGFTLLEALLALAVVLIVAVVSVPATTGALDDVRDVVWL